MERKLLQTLLVLACVATVGYGFYAFIYYPIIYHPFVVEPKQDLTFLRSNPSRSEVIKYFGIPHESLKAGKRFPMTGWRPLPDRIASHAAFAFGRRNGIKIYIFFGPDGKMEEFVISHS